MYENVRCLECGTEYAKPARSGAARADAGCPECGYGGWLSVKVPVRRQTEPRRSDEDRPQPRSAQSR